MAKEYYIKDFLKRIKRPIELNGDQEYKLVTIKMNHNGVILREKKKGCDIKSNMYLVKKGDFILSGIDARNGAFGIIPPDLDDAIVTNDFWYFDLDEDVISKELFLEITSTGWFDEICKKGSDGTTQRIRLQKDKFFNQKIWLPEKDEQKIILEKIRVFKNRLELLSKQIEIQEYLQQKLKQAILQEAIQGKLTADWRTQNPDVEPASELLKRIKAEKAQLIKEKKIKKEKPLPPISNDEIPFDLPENWIWCRLGEITTYGSSQKAEPGHIKNETWVLDLEDIEKNTSKIIQEISFKQRNSNSTKSVFKKGDVLYSKLRPYLDKVVVAPKNGVCTTEILPLPMLAENNPYYFMYALKRRDFLQYVSTKVSGMKMPRLGTTEGKNALFPLPPLEEQFEIVRKIELLLERCNQLASEIENQKKDSQDLQKALFNEIFELKEHKSPEITSGPKSKTQAISLKPTNIDYHKRSVLAAEIVWQLHKEPTLGHLKLQKLIFLCQKTGNMQLATNFLRQAMGPYDNQLMRSIDKQLKQHKWFEYCSAENFKYQPLEKAGAHHVDYQKYFSDESANIQYIIDTFKKAKSSTVEIVATLYACMENILEEKNTIYSENLLIQRFYEWSEEKQKFSEDEVRSVLKRMKEIGIVPDGLKN